MNLLTVNLMSSCNYSCGYCPTKQWHKPADYVFPPLYEGDAGTPQRVNCITNDALLKWLDKYLDPEEWLIEITGGEPGLHPEIKTLIPALNVRGYNGLIKTNGSLPIPKSKNFSRIACWHSETDFPVSYDVILIIRNPNDDWRSKTEICKNQKTPYRTTMFDEYYKTRQVIPPEKCFENKILKYLHMNSMGQLSGCSRKPGGIECSIFTLSMPPVLQVAKECPRCKNINDVVVFLSDGMRKKIENDYLEYAKGENF